MVLPELFGGVLARDALEDLDAARVLVDELRDVVHVRVDDDEHVLVLVVLGDLGRREGLVGHGGLAGRAGLDGEERGMVCVCLAPRGRGRENAWARQ